MKFIHCSDLHLDASLDSKLPPSKAKERRGELLTAFSRLAQVAEDNGVTAVIIAGDLFDRPTVTVKARRFVLETVAKHSSVDFLLLTGNHDEKTLSEIDVLPENLHIFDRENISYSYGNVTVTAAYPDEALSAIDRERLNIVVMHGAVGSEINLERYKEKGIDYLALGHYHDFSVRELDRRGVYAYSGCLEGRGFDECGEKGYVMLDTDGKRISYEFVGSSIRRVLDIPVDMSDCTGLAEQEKKIKNALDGVSRSDMVRLTVIGSYELGREKFYENIVRGLQDDFFYIEYKDVSTLKICPEDYIGDISLKGEFIRLVMDEIEDEAERSRVISLGIKALRGDELI